MEVLEVVNHTQDKSHARVNAGLREETSETEMARERLEPNCCPRLKMAMILSRIGALNDSQPEVLGVQGKGLAFD